MITTNKESHSGVIYKGIIWFNTYDNCEKWLKSIYDYNNEVSENNVKKITPIITKLIIDGRKVE